MKVLTAAVLMGFLLSSFAKKEKWVEIEIVNYHGGSKYTEERQFAPPAGAIDLHYLSKHIYKPFYLPPVFIDTNYKNQTITIWANPDRPKNTNDNWYNSYTYDSLSRVIRYMYSGCIFCNGFPYNYTVKYNKNGFVESIENYGNSEEGYVTYYDYDGNITRVDCCFKRYKGNIEFYHEDAYAIYYNDHGDITGIDCCDGGDLGFAISIVKK